MTYLATAPKSNASYAGLLAARKDAKEKGNLPVPLHLRNAATSLMKDLDYGKGYRYAHDDPKGAKDQTHLPKELEGRRYYHPKSLPKYYRPISSSSPADDEEDLNSPW